MKHIEFPNIKYPKIKIKANNKIFTKNVNSKFKLVPFNIKVTDKGNVKYFPAASKEWRNKIYLYNDNNMKNLPIYDLNINKLTKSYFNSYFNNKFILKNHLSWRWKSLSKNIIYISKPEIKHTTSKAIITIYIYNREHLSLSKIINKMRKIKMKMWVFKNNFSSFTWNMKKSSFFKGIEIYFNNLKYKYKEVSVSLYNKAFKLMFNKQLTFIRRYKLRLNLNKYKFESIFINRLGELISKYFNKQVEFNIVNLQSIILNPDIFTEFMARKLKKRTSNIIRVMSFILNKAKLPRLNKRIIKNNLTKNVDFNLLENKYKNLNLNSMINKSGLNKILKKLYETKFTSFNYKNIFKLIKGNKKIFFNEYKNIALDYIKYKNIGGIRLEIKGRLTRRYRADRAKFKMRWKGGLQNYDSSFKGLPAVTFRGYANSNVEYSIRTSKRRIGAFAVKGWISGR
jgi:hypothetical protein